MADTVKVHLKWRNLYDYCKASAKNIAIEYAGKRIEFEDGEIRIETIDEPDRTGKKQDEGYYKIYGKNHYANHEIRKMEIPEPAKPCWAANRIQEGEKAIAELERLKASRSEVLRISGEILEQAEQERIETIDEPPDLVCDLCGKKETPPYAEGDTCYCGGVFCPVTPARRPNMPPVMHL